ncbi:MAG: CRISPR system precrRNA processing endoribonuclease RAMP protein Cas6 [Atribacterota bacterium]
MELEQFTMEDFTINSNEVISWTDKNYNLYRIKIEFETLNTGKIPLFNLSMIQGMFLSLIEDVNYKISRIVHDNHKMKPWSFSLLYPDKYEKSSKKGFYKIKKGTRCKWFFHTISKGFKDIIISAFKEGLTVNFKHIKGKIKKLKVEDHTYQTPPEEGFKFIKIKLHSPTFFYLQEKNKLLEFSIESLFIAQLKKLKKLGFIKEYNKEKLLLLVRIYESYLQERSCVIKKYGYRSENKDLFGKYGNFVIKVNGSFKNKTSIWELFNLSQFLGIGSKSSMGFGHNSLMKVS